MTRKSSKKETNSIAQAGLLSKVSSWEEFLNKDSLIYAPTRKEWRQRLANTLLSWADDNDSLEIIQFCRIYKVPYTSLLNWVKKYEDLKEAYDFSKLLIASRRRIGSMQKRLDGAYAYRDMHMYDPEWHAINKYHADLKKEEEKASHTFIINTDKPRVLSKDELKGEGEK